MTTCCSSHAGGSGAVGIELDQLAERSVLVASRVLASVGTNLGVEKLITLLISVATQRRLADKTTPSEFTLGLQTLVSRARTVFGTSAAIGTARIDAVRLGTALVDADVVRAEIVIIAFLVAATATLLVLVDAASLGRSVAHASIKSARVMIIALLRASTALGHEDVLADTVRLITLLDTPVNGAGVLVVALGIRQTAVGNQSVMTVAVLVAPIVGARILIVTISC